MSRLIKALSILIFLFPLAVLAQSYSVGQKTTTYIDEERNRMVKTEIWYPALENESLKNPNEFLPFRLSETRQNARFVNKAFPLIVLSHGTGGSRLSMAWLAIGLAKSGYIVAAPDHWGNTFDNKIPAYFTRYWERPQDISFLLTSILNDKSFSSFIDKNRIAAIGFSLGGYTVLAAGGVELDCDVLKKSAVTSQGKKEFTIPEMGDLSKAIANLHCTKIPKTFKDERIKLVIAMSPALGQGMPSKKQNLDIPVLILGAENDQVTPFKTNAFKYHKLIPSSRLIKLGGRIGHYIFLNEALDELKINEKIYYVDDIGVNRVDVHQSTTTEILNFLSNSLQ